LDHAGSIDIDRFECSLDLGVSSRLLQELPCFLVFWELQFSVSVFVESVEGILQGHVHLVVFVNLRFDALGLLELDNNVVHGLLDSALHLLFQDASSSGGHSEYFESILLFGLSLLVSAFVVFEESCKSVEVAVHLGQQESERKFFNPSSLDGADELHLVNEA